MKVFERYFLWDEFLKYVDWQPANSQEKSHGAEFSPHDLPAKIFDLEYKKQGWYGTSSFDEAMLLGRDGWVQKAAQVQNMVVNSWKTFIDVRPWNPIHSVEGSNIDIGAFIAGNPECMLRRKNSVTKSANIVINVGHNYEVRPSEIIKNGKQIVNIVNSFEKNNIHTRLVIMVATKDEREDVFRTFVVCKDLYDKFDLKRVMFAVAHPSFLRRLWFSMAERESMEIRNKFGFLFGSGYGSAVYDFEYKNDKNLLYFVVKKNNPSGLRPLDYVRKIEKQMFDIAKSNAFAYSEFNQNLQNLAIQRFISTEKSY